jgi:hypothetical protein
MRERFQLLGVAVLALALSACDSSPTSPGNRLTLTPGAYEIFLSTTAAGNAWTARSTTAADGDFEFRFQDTGGTAQSLFVPISGTVSGTAISKSTTAQNRTTALVTGPATAPVSGQFVRDIPGISGNAIVVLGQGKISVTATSTTAAVSHTCALMIDSWSLNKVL